MKSKYIRTKYLFPLVMVLSSILAVAIPGVGDNQTVQTILTVSGILFAIVLGFFINDLWSRFEKIRESVALEASGFLAYFSFTNSLAEVNKSHQEWKMEQGELINNYLRKVIKLEWHDYEKTDPLFNKIIDAQGQMSETKSNVEIELYTNMLQTITSISNARETLIIIGKDKLSKIEWTVIMMLTFTIIFSLFYLKEPTLTSILFTALLSGITLTLLLVLQDLNNLSFGEEVITFEPYEKIFDRINKPRYFPKSLKDNHDLG